MDSVHRRRSSSDRFLTTFLPPSIVEISSSDELNEDDVFFSTTDFHSPSHHHNHHHLHITKSFTSDKSGILAALPETTENHHNRSVFNHKPLKSSLSSNSRMMMIPVVPKPTAMVNRQLPHQSAPVNVPLMARRVPEVNSEEDCEDDEEDGEMLPPHEIVARKSANSPVFSCSVLEGAGRTLKGRDLRQVRNAVFRQTGFID